MYVISMYVITDLYYLYVNYNANYFQKRHYGRIFVVIYTGFDQFYIISNANNYPKWYTHTREFSLWFISKRYSPSTQKGSSNTTTTAPLPHKVIFNIQLGNEKMKY